MVRLTVNGKRHEVDVEPDTPCCGYCGNRSASPAPSMAAASRNAVHARFTSMVRLCARARCRSAKLKGKQVTTIEGLAQNGVLHKVQKAWLDHDVPQCGYCQTGMIMAVAALLKDKAKPTDADIDSNITNICRCGTYQQVRAAIHAAAVSA
jgi:isoquinoline 1-oxidoreductase alpha subunit